MGVWGPGFGGAYRVAEARAGPLDSADKCRVQCPSHAFAGIWAYLALSLEALLSTVLQNLPHGE